MHGGGWGALKYYVSCEGTILAWGWIFFSPFDGTLGEIRIFISCYW